MGIKHHSYLHPVAACDPHMGLTRAFRGDVETRHELLDSTLVLLNRLHLQNKTPRGFCPVCEFSENEYTRIVQLADESCINLPSCLASRVASLIPGHITVTEGHEFPDPGLELQFHDRPIDVLFFTSMGPTAGHIHRMWARQKMMELQKNRPRWKVVVHEPVPSPQFRTLLRQTKVFVSPWGAGEWSGKDEESVLSGAVMVKPMAGAFDHIVDIYTPNVSCLSVRPDFNDLESTLDWAMSDLAVLERISRRAHLTASSFSGYGQAVKQSIVVDGFAALLKNVLDICTTA